MRCEAAIPGVRLVRAVAEQGAYFTAIPAAFARREAEWLIVPIEHIFGSEELSLQSPRRRRTGAEPLPGLECRRRRAASTWKNGTGEVEIELGGAKQRLPLKVLPDLPAGIAGIPAGLTSARGEGLPAWSRIERVS